MSILWKWIGCAARYELRKPYLSARSGLAAPAARQTLLGCSRPSTYIYNANQTEVFVHLFAQHRHYQLGGEQVCWCSKRTIPG